MLALVRQQLGRLARHLNREWRWADFGDLGWDD